MEETVEEYKVDGENIDINDNIDNENDEISFTEDMFNSLSFSPDDFIDSEIKDERITELVDKAITIKLIKSIPQDINIDFAMLLGITNKDLINQLDRIKDIGIKRRKVNGTKFFKFLKDFKVILSFMNEEEIEQLLSLRVMMYKYETLKKKEISNIMDAALLTFIPFVNRFIKHIDPIAYTPKCKTIDDKSLQELYFSEHHLIYLVKIIIISKITLIFTDNVHKDYKTEAKKLLAKKIWNIVFEDVDRNIDMKNKIHKLISSRFVSTIYNEKRFWSAAQFANINMVSQANLLYNELQTDSILMLEFDKNPLSFLDVFLKNTIFYLSKRKFPLEFVLSNFNNQVAVMESEVTTEYKYNMLEGVLMNKTIDDFIIKKVNPIITKHDLDDFMNNFKKNIVHFWIVIPYISRILKISPMFLMGLDRERFIMLTIYTYYKLINIKCYNMSMILRSNMKENNTGTYNEHVKNMSNILSRFLKSDDLQNFITNFKLNDNITDTSKIIISPLITMTMNTFYNFNDQKVSIISSEILNEYITFLKHYIDIK